MNKLIPTILIIVTALFSGGCDLIDEAADTVGVNKRDEVPASTDYLLASGNYILSDSPQLLSIAGPTGRQIEADADRPFNADVRVVFGNAPSTTSSTATIDVRRADDVESLELAVRRALVSVQAKQYGGRSAPVDFDGVSTSFDNEESQPRQELAPITIINNTEQLNPIESETVEN